MSVEHFDGGLRLPALQGDDPEMMQGAEMVAVERQHLAIEVLRFDELPGLVVLPGERKQRGRRRRRAHRARALARRAPLLSVHAAASSLSPRKRGEGGPSEARAG